jgi:uncharacterized DUF497 family protein
MLDIHIKDMYNYHMNFEWDENKNLINTDKHGVSFETAQEAFFDFKRIIIPDKKHSQKERRFYCIGRVEGAIITVRYTKRNGKIRIFGAGYWREGREIYEEKNSL